MQAWKDHHPDRNPVTDENESERIKRKSQVIQFIKKIYESMGSPRKQDDLSLAYVEGTIFFIS